MQKAEASEGFDAHPHIEIFAQTISEQPLGLAHHQPLPWATNGRCFENAHRQAQEQGGRALFGWMFHYRIVADIPGPGYLIAVHHAVWHAPPDGRIVDVTPFHADAKHHPITQRGDVLFLVDTRALPISVGSTTIARSSKFYAVGTDKRLLAHVQHLQSEEDEACKRAYPSL